MQILHPSQYTAVRDLFQPLAFHLCIPSLLERGEPGTVWVDDPQQPRSALARIGQRFFLCGQEDQAAFIHDLRQLFSETIYPQALADHQVEFAIFYSSPLWEQAIGEILAGKDPIRGMRQYYHRSGAPASGWRESIPPGFWIQRINADLLAQKDLDNFEDMYAEITSEAPSVASFLENRFGFCLRDDRTIAGWCMSEYNSPTGCEIGIETVGEYQKRGFARITASAVMEHACSVGITEIGWDCWADNTASGRTALSLGFSKACDYPVFLAWFDQAGNLAVNGNVRFRAGKTAEALDWFERAFQLENAPLWSYVVAAFAYNLNGDPAAALSCLRTVMQKGFEGRDWITSSEHLASLHGTSEWQALFGDEDQSKA